MTTNNKYSKLTTAIPSIAISTLATAGITALSANDALAQETYNRFADYCLNYDSLSSAKDKATVKYLLTLYASDGYGLSIGDTTEKTTWDKVVGTDLCNSAEQYYKQYQYSGTKVEGTVERSLRLPRITVGLSNHAPNGISLPHSGLGPLIGFNQLKALSVTCDGQATNLEAIATLTNLEKLELINCDITDISPLSGLTKLVVLNLERNAINDLTPLASLTSLESLNLYNQVDNAVEQQARADGIAFNDGYFQGYLADLSPLASLTNLKLLQLSNNSIEDISPLNSLTNLVALDISKNKITDLSSLSSSSLSRLLGLNVFDNYIPPEAICPFEGSYAYHESRCVGLDEQQVAENPDAGEPVSTPQQTTQPSNTVNSTPPQPNSPNQTQEKPSLIDEVNNGVEETIEQAPDRILDSLF